jgi:hypothetical protein
LVNSPNGGEDWMKTKTYPITWTALGNLNDTSVSLDYSTDNGTTWTSIATRQPNDGNYKWTVPSTETSGALIRVTAIDIDGIESADTSDATFAIDPPPPKAGEFFAPAAGDVVAPGASQASWVVHDPWGLAERPLTLELTVDGGATWTLLEDGLAFTDGIGWDVPVLGTSSDRCRLRLTVLSWLGDLSIIESGEFAVDMLAPTAAIESEVGQLKAGEDLVVRGSVDDDLGVRTTVLHVVGGDGERTYIMTDDDDDGSWIVTFSVRDQDTSMWIVASDGFHSVSSETIDLHVRTSAGGSTGTSSIVWELAAATVIALVVTLSVILVLRRRRG